MNWVASKIPMLALIPFPTNLSRAAIVFCAAVFLFILNFFAWVVGGILREASPQPVVPPEGRREPAPAGDVQEDEPLGALWRRAIRPIAILGALLSPLQAIALAVNVYLLQLTLVIIFNVVPDSLFVLGAIGRQFNVTIFTAYGLLISLGQAIAAAIAGHNRLAQADPKSGKHELPLSVRAFANLSFIVLAFSEIAASFYRSYVANDRDMLQAIGGGLISLGVVLITAAVGLVFLDGFLLPFVHAVLATILTFVMWVASLLSTAARAAGKGRRYGLGILEQFNSMIVGVRELDEILWNPLIRKARANPITTICVLLGLILALVVLSSCQVQPAQPLEPVVFFLAIDCTNSVPAAEFFDYQNMALRMVFAYIRAGDELFLIPIVKHPQNAVIYQAFEQAQVWPIAREFFRQHVQSLTQPKSGSEKPDFTDLGAVITYVTRTLDARPSRHAVAIIASDGGPTGRQTVDLHRVPQDLSVWVVGVHPENEKSLDHLLGQFSLPRSKLKIVSYGGWPAYADDLGRALGRNSDPRALTLLSPVQTLPTNQSLTKENRK